MGGNMARRLAERRWVVHGFDVHPGAINALSKEGVRGAKTLEALVAALPQPRVVWLMVTAGKAGETVLFGKSGLMHVLSKGDIVIDGGNSYFKHSIERAKKFEKRGIAFVDVGFSGGPEGALKGGCLMIGGTRVVFEKLEHLFRDLAAPGAYKFFKGAGAGHFVKMVHNGIEYGMMQAIAEGFNLMRKSKFKLNLVDVADIYNHQSVIESRLTKWLQDGLEKKGQNLKHVAGSVGHLGEGEWTVRTAKEMNVPLKVIEESFKFRVQSEKNPSYTGKVVQLLREQFGGPRTKTS
jgi:6-phosphogluconate dehydrogenase